MMVMRLLVSGILLLVLSRVIVGSSNEGGIEEITSLEVVGESKEILENQPFQFYSQFKQDRFLYENIFQRKMNGIFVDIGAYDGITFSNTYFFEKNLNWTGICIEPIPSVYQNLKRNRKAKAIEGAVCNKVDFQNSNGTNLIQFLHIKNFSEMLSGIVDHYSKAHFARIDLEIQELNQHWEVFYVQCLDVNSILDENNLDHVDYLSMDIEGGELEILQSLDFEKFDIYVISVENDEKDPDLRDYMKSKGYRLYGQGIDDVYIKQSTSLLNKDL